MLPFDTLIPVNKELPLPVYQQIANHVIVHIRNGVLKPRNLLPGTREMARILNLHRKTVISAYEELAAQAWVTVIPKRGFMIAQNLPEVKARKWDDGQGQAYESKINAPFYHVKKDLKILPPATYRPELIITEGLPDNRLAPMDLLLREYRSRFNQPYPVKAPPGADTPGSLNLRKAMSKYLSETRGLQAEIPNILITHGAQMSIYIAASLLLKPGDHVIVGEPGYHVANQLFEKIGAVIIRVPVDDNGMNVDAVDLACQKYKPKMLYLIPHHHHPTTVTLSPDRRMSLLEVADKFNFAIVEDDYDYGFHYDSSPYLPLASSSHRNRVIYIGSFSKSLATSIRVGFMIAAEDFIEQAIYLRRMIDLRGDHFMEDSLATLIEDGDISRHLKKVNKIYAERRDYLCSLLDLHLKEIVSYKKPTGGMAVWTTFDKKYPLQEISSKAAKQGLFISNGTLFDSPGRTYNALRLGFASLNPPELAAAVEIVRSCC